MATLCESSLLSHETPLNPLKKGPSWRAVAQSMCMTIAVILFCRDVSLPLLLSLWRIVIASCAGRCGDGAKLVQIAVTKISRHNLELLNVPLSHTILWFSLLICTRTTYYWSSMEALTAFHGVLITAQHIISQLYGSIMLLPLLLFWSDWVPQPSDMP